MNDMTRTNDANQRVMRESWGTAPPAWVVALAEECDRTSQTQAAKRLNVSGSMVNQALRNAYKGRLDRLEERVRGEFMNETVACPVLGQISSRECLDNQQQPYSPANHMRVTLFRTCRTCPNNRTKREAP